MNSDTQLYIDGQWRAGRGGSAPVLNPANEETIAVVPRCGAEDVDAAVSAAKAALPAWLDTTPGERSELLLGLAGVLEQHSDELAAIESANVGKPLAHALGELPILAGHVRFFAGAARILEGKSADTLILGVPTEHGFREAAACDWYRVSLPKLDVTAGPLATNEPPLEVRVGDSLDWAPNPKGAAAGTTYVLKQGPDGMTIDATTAKVAWKPDEASIGKHDVEIVAKVGAQETPFVSFTIRVVPRSP